VGHFNFNAVGCDVDDDPEGAIKRPPLAKGRRPNQKTTDGGYGVTPDLPGSLPTVT
jgi:hypothetical protein